MMSDCHERKIDIILVKSISRFGRNTLDTINALNELKALGVNVIFEIEKLNSFCKQSALMITICAALYQNESEQKSIDIKWGVNVVLDVLIRNIQIVVVLDTAKIHLEN